MIDRAFGVELEFDSNGLHTDGVRRVLGEAFDREGLRRWHFMDRISHDGSELELATPILRGKDGFKKLKVVMDTLSNHGCYTTDSDGLHVHHDAPDYVDNIDNCIRLVKSWKRNRHLIYRFVSSERYESDYYGKSNRNVYWACPEWSDQAIHELETRREIPYWDRYDLNLSAIPKYGSIEIRLHEGTLNFAEAESWILFGQKFMNRCSKSGMYDSETTENLLKKVQVSKSAERVLLDKSKYGPNVGL